MLLVSIHKWMMTATKVILPRRRKKIEKYAQRSTLTDWSVCTNWKSNLIFIPNRPVQWNKPVQYINNIANKHKHVARERARRGISMQVLVLHLSHVHIHVNGKQQCSLKKTKPLLYTCVFVPLCVCVWCMRYTHLLCLVVQALIFIPYTAIGMLLSHFTSFSSPFIYYFCLYVYVHVCAY